MNKILVVSLVAAAGLVACASAPERNEQLDQARMQVQKLSQDPLAAQAASQDLETARSELAQAEAALEKRAPADQVTHMAYLAARHAEIGQARIAEARAREQVAQGDADRNRVLLQARTREAEQAKQQTLTAQQEALAARASAESLTQQLAALQAQQTQRGMVMTLGDVLFDTGAATLKPGADLTLNRLADFLKENSRVRVIVEGHTDSVGSDAYNENLSRRRGQAVSDALATRGVTTDRVEVIARGEAYPVASNDTGAGRQQNRRVEVIFSDDQGRFAQGAKEGALR